MRLLNSMRVLGVDYGTKKTGLAIGDDESRVAMPFGVVYGLDEIAGVVEREGVDKVVVGMPVSDVDTAQADVVRAFIEDLKVVVKVDIDTVDERYTTKAAQQLQEEQGSGVAEDALAAMILLQAYFDTD